MSRGYRKRKPVKEPATGQSADRSEQFRIIALVTALFMVTDENPIISINTKKKEIMGNLTGGEAILTEGGQAVQVYDHDYPYLGAGKAIPHGIYNNGTATLSSSTVSGNTATSGAGGGIFSNRLHTDIEQLNDQRQYGEQRRRGVSSAAAH